MRPHSILRTFVAGVAAIVVLCPATSTAETRFGLALFGVFVLLFLGTVLVALAYLQLD